MKTKQTFFKQSLAMFLSLLLMVSVFPLSVFAVAPPALLNQSDNKVNFLSETFGNFVELKKEILDELLDLDEINRGEAAVKNAALNGDSINYDNFSVTFDAQIKIPIG